MAGHILDNPIWETLRTNHSALAIGGDHARRFPPEVAPFIALASPSSEATAEVQEIVQPGETVCVLATPPDLTAGWEVVSHIQLVQFVCDRDVQPPETTIEPLGAEDLQAMLDLTALVYPAYFRPRTVELGPYFGIKHQGELVAMAGIRFSVDGFREISAVCTHPDFRGRGFAKDLMRHLCRFIMEAGDRPFLHTEADNVTARAMYGSLGFSARAELPFWKLIRK